MANVPTLACFDDQSSHATWDEHLTSSRVSEHAKKIIQDRFKSISAMQVYRCSMLSAISVAVELILATFPADKIHCDATARQSPSSDDGIWGRRLDAAAHGHRLSQSDHLELIRRSLPSIANKTLTVCVVVREPFVIFDEPRGWANMSVNERRLIISDIDNYSGVAIEVVKRFRSIFKFNIRMMRPSDNQFGVVQPGSRQWTGLMGVLDRKEADIGLTALSITMGRAQAIDFTRAYFVETVAILVKTPEEVQNYLAIFEPFSPTVWFVLLGTILVLIFLITIMTKLEDNQLKKERTYKLMKLLGAPQQSHDADGNELNQTNSPGDLSAAGQDRANSNRVQHKISALTRAEQEHEFGTSWLERFYYAVTCVLNILLIRDIKHPPHQTPIRVLVCIWWLSTIVIVNIYLGILFGQLVIPRRLKSIETLEELVNQDKIEWAVTRGSAIYELFRQSEPTSIYGQLGKRMRNVTTADEGVQRVVNSNWAFIRERSILTFKVAQEHNKMRACRMQFGREDFYSVGFGIGLAKNSSLLKPFNSALTLMIENGFVARWQAMYWPRRNQYTECKLQPSEGQPLTIKHFLSIYLVCTIIIGASSLLLVYQNLHESARTHILSR